jgi:hypothetical protein
MKLKGFLTLLADLLFNYGMEDEEKNELLKTGKDLSRI